MRLPTALAALPIATCLFVADAAAQKAPPPEAPPPAKPCATPASPGNDITICNSPGAVTAQTMNVGQMIVYQEARRDPVTRQLVTTLRRHVQTSMDQTALTDGQPVYLFALDDRTKATDKTGRMYNFIAGLGAERLFGPSAAKCEIAGGITVAGYVMRRSADLKATTIETRVLTREDDPLLQRICRGLRMPVTSLSDSADGTSRGNVPTVFDYLRRDQNGVGFTFITAEGWGGSLEESWFKHYWAEALARRYRHTPNSLPPEVFGQMPSLGRGESVTGHYPGLAMAPGTSLYLPEARREFGARLDRLDADWADYLKTAMVTVRNQARPIMASGGLARVLTRYRTDEVGSVSFWRSANDLVSIMQQAHCVAQQFLVDREYIPPEDAPFIERCALSDIRVPAP